MKNLDPNSEASINLKNGRYVIRKMTSVEFKEITILWMTKEGWNPGLNDHETFFQADPEGFFVGELDGRPVATLSAVKHSKDFGFFGCYIVDPAIRGKGYGLALHEAGRSYLKGCTQGGDAVVANIEIYKQIGRVFSHMNTRFKIVRGHEVSHLRPHPVVDARSVDFQSMAQFDEVCFPSQRRNFLMSWLHQKNAFAKACVEGSKVQGYGVIRQCQNGWKIGPLFAKESTYAEALLISLVESIPVDDFCIIDMPHCNLSALPLAEKWGMSEVFKTARMYTGLEPIVRTDYIYGLTTLEIG